MDNDDFDGPDLSHDHLERDHDEAYEYEAGDDEHDGQPDEAQEWHDFDPDC